VRAIAEVATAVTQGDLTRSIQVQVQGELDELKNNINEMIRNLKETTLKNAEQDWLKTNLAKFTRMLQGQRDLLTVGRLILSELAPLVDAKHGVFYTVRDGDGETRLRLLASYAFTARKNVSNEFRLGEGLVGQAALERQRIVLTNVPADYVQVHSGLGQAPPLNIVVLPVTFEGEVKAVMELASFERFSATHLTFLEQLTEGIGIVLNTIQANTRTEDLLRQSQSLSSELQSQQKELQQSNEQLEEKARLLAEQNMEVERKNSEVEQARQALEEKAAQLALTSKYKSEFLANMSHELRTPLNSLLILAEQLSDNPQGNLSPRQIEFAKTIHASGRDLLALINDILDLSKIESGTVSVDTGTLYLGEVADQLDRSFRHLADSKGLQFKIDVDPNAPEAISTDAKRLHQVLKNLLSNAFKFTEQGSVEVKLRRAEQGWSPEHPILRRAAGVLAISVRDTGIGIEPEKQHIIFEAFQQADGGTARRYGGTGLGLAISREISRLLGGELQLQSTPGRGSTFTLYIPFARGPEGGAHLPVRSDATALLARPEPAPASAVIVDDRAAIKPDDRVLLVVEDDAGFAAVLAEMGHAAGFKVVVATRGADALQTARELKPDAITFDVGLPDQDGWRVLDRLKDDSETRHIPLYLISAADELERSLRRGAVGFLAKPAEKEQVGNAMARLRELSERTVSRLLVVEPEEARRNQIVELLGSPEVETTLAKTPAEAIEALATRSYDCVVLSERGQGAGALDVLQHMRKQPALKTLPVVLFDEQPPAPKEEAQLKRLSQELVMKCVRSVDRLVDEATLFLGREAARLPETQRRIVERLHSADILSGRTVLLVDDDVRNIFAMTSLLERYGMQVVTAENGKQALEALEKHPEVEAVLMDIMLPEMDGYETTRIIRRMPDKRDLPILALTAKAMKRDREKCIEAGASDYLAKPVEADHLLGVLRNWLHR
jgi:signal transduction histidine kinase/CheY-like chemotaxis protein